MRKSVPPVLLTVLAFFVGHACQPLGAQSAKTVCPRPEAGSYYRSDHFSLSRVGIPAFSVDSGTLYEGHDHAWGIAQEKDYNEHH